MIRSSLLILCLCTLQHLGNCQLVYDESFGINGMASHSIGDFTDTPYALKVLPDGKILIAGVAYEGSDANFAICKLNSDGSLDNSFNGTGKRIIDYATTEDMAYSLAVNNENGKIYISGYFPNGGGYDFITQSLNEDGSNNTDFLNGNAGYTYFDEFNAYDEYAYTSAVQADGKLIVAGDVSGSMGICRIRTDGYVDATFGYDGYRIISFLSNSQEHIRCISLQSDGRILISGYVIDASGVYIVAARLLPNGFLDNTFSDDGKIFIQHGNNDFGYGNYSIAQQSDGKIVIAGSNGNGAENFIVVRLNSDGSLDNSFCGSGKLNLYGSTSGPIGNILALQEDGKIVVAADNKITRIDASMETPIIESITLHNFALNQGPRAIALQPDGKIVGIGSRGNQGMGEFCTVRIRNSAAEIQENKKIEIRIFPNPCTKSFTVNISETFIPLNVHLYSSTGKALQVLDINNNNQLIDVSSYPNGLYYISISKGGTNISNDIIIKN